MPAGTKQLRKKKKLVLFVGVLVAAVVGLGISESVIYSGGRGWTSSSTACPAIPSTTSLKVVQLSSVWHWTYQTDDGGSVAVKQVRGVVRASVRALFVRTSTCACLCVCLCLRLCLCLCCCVAQQCMCRCVSACARVRSCVSAHACVRE